VDPTLRLIANTKKRTKEKEQKGNREQESERRHPKKQSKKERELGRQKDKRGEEVEAYRDHIFFLLPF